VQAGVTYLWAVDVVVVGWHGCLSLTSTATVRDEGVEKDLKDSTKASRVQLNFAFWSSELW
jgi:hypothetical protein